MRVWVYPERKYEELGAIGYEIQWEGLTAAAEKKVGTNEDIDPDADIVNHYLRFSTKEEAERKAREVVDSGNTAFGQVTVQKQVVDWFVREDRIAEWQDCGEPEYVD